MCVRVHVCVRMLAGYLNVLFHIIAWTSLMGEWAIKLKVTVSVDSSILNDRRSIVLTPSFKATVS